MQPNDSGKGARAVGLGQKALYAVARINGWEALSNSTRSRDAAKTSMTTKLATHQNTSATAAG
jgi:hypothetical protein